MSLIEIVMQGDITHLVPAADKERHQLHDTVFCACAPTAHMDETDPNLALIVQHVVFAKRIERRLFLP